MKLQEYTAITILTVAATWTSLLLSPIATANGSKDGHICEDPELRHRLPSENRQALTGRLYERTLLLVKPDGVMRGLVGELLNRFEKREMRVVGAKLVTPTEELLTRHYAEHENQPFFLNLLKAMKGPVLAVILEGVEVVEKVRVMIGPTDPTKALPGTVRGDFGTDILHNVVHASKCVKTAYAEITMWFAEEEIVDWNGLFNAKQCTPKEA